MNFISRAAYLFHRTDLLPDFRWEMSALLSTSLRFKFLGYQRYSERTVQSRLWAHTTLPNATGKSFYKPGTTDQGRFFGTHHFYIGRHLLRPSRGRGVVLELRQWRAVSGFIIWVPPLLMGILGLVYWPGYSWWTSRVVIWTSLTCYLWNWMAVSLLKSLVGIYEKERSKVDNSFDNFYW